MSLRTVPRLALAWLLVVAPPTVGAAPICLGLGPETEVLDPEVERLAGVAGALASGPPIARQLAALRIARGTDLCLESALLECRAFFTPDTNAIVLKTGLPEPLMTLLVVHELRHLDQIDRGFLPDPDLSRRATVRHVFALEADAQAIVSHFAWEARESDPAIWESLLDMPNYADIATAYAEIRQEGGTVAESTLGAFEQWYGSEWRRENYYHAICSDYLDELDLTKRLAGTRALDPDRLRGLCLLADGTDYGCADSPQIALHPPKR